jgi:replicative DNA helicase
MIIYAPAVSIVEQIVKVEDFYRPAHQHIFQAIMGLSVRGDPVDLVTLRDEMEKAGKLDAVGGVEYLVALVQGVPTAANTDYYAKIVRDKAALRNLIVMGTQIASQGFDVQNDPRELIHAAQVRLNELSLACEDVKEDGPIGSALDEALDAADRIQRDPGVRLLTGIPELDDFCGGFLPGEVVTLGARTSSGKSTLACNMVASVAANGGAALIVSAEMARAQVAKRFIQSHAHIWGSRFRTGNLSESEWECAHDAADGMRNWKVHIIGKPMTIPQIGLRAKQLSAVWRQPVKLVVIDYLQIMRPHEGKTIREQVMAMSRDVKQLAGELGTTMLVLSQFSRALPDSKGRMQPPSINDLKESGSIENDSDVVLLMHRPEPQPMSMRNDNSLEVWLRVGKGRDIGDTPWPDPDHPDNGGIKMRWYPGMTLFTPWMTPLSEIPRLQAPPKPPIWERTGKQHEPMGMYLARNWHRIAGE